MPVDSIEFHSLYSVSVLLTGSLFHNFQIYPPAPPSDWQRWLQSIFHWSIKIWIKLWEPRKCKQGSLGHSQILFVCVSTRADINLQIGDKLKGDTKKDDTFRKETLSYFFSYHSSLLKQLLLNQIHIYCWSSVIFSSLSKWCIFSTHYHAWW